MLSQSFKRETDAEGWRYGLGYRTRRDRFGIWAVEHWGGAEVCWEFVGSADSYAEARDLASRDEQGRKV